MGCYFELRDFKIPNGGFIDAYEFGSEVKYRYKANPLAATSSSTPSLLTYT